MILIDTEWLKELYQPYENYNDKELAVPIGAILANIDDAPTINVVRCKECKYESICSHSVQHTTHEPTSVTIGYKSIDYCSYGEYKEKCKECWYWSEVHKCCENKCGCQFKPYGERKENK